MIINHQYRFIFLKTRKTAGTSIEIALSKYCGDGDVISTIRVAMNKSVVNADIRGREIRSLRCCFMTGKTSSDWCEGAKRQRLAHANARFARRFAGKEIWNSYFKFCFERNPFDKAISRYYWRTLQPRPPIADSHPKPTLTRSRDRLDLLHYFRVSGD